MWRVKQMAAVIAQPKQLLVRSARMVGLSRTAAARAAAPISASAVTMCKGRALVASPGISSKKMEVVNASTKGVVDV